ncbi:hypothetical protein ORJ66_20825 [Pseudoalteromonas tunicata]|uniref:hypothetical protein n=1 Tax=Pseudoalteromonas tunicata TaxID=314281 RepID=UPI00273DAEA8|nr:hypothetical protein [Pseudoalteromonas tunicata]MDP5215493.1 hypothetical protein [Pseudoalteromonas tunicata]
MQHFIDALLGTRFAQPLWLGIEPIREELFGLERLEEHAASLATAQRVTLSPPKVLSLHKRLDANATALLDAYYESAAELERSENVVPAAEWLLDNYHLVEAQIREIRDDLPPSYYRQLPKLAQGPLAGYPRVFGLAWAYVAHTDSHVDLDVLLHFVNAYQHVQPLTIGELWAVAITLRIVLIENLRRLADQISQGRIHRNDADALATRLLMAGCANSALQDDIETRSSKPLSEDFAAQLVKRLRDQDPKTTPALEWLEKRLKDQDLTVDEVVQSAQKRQGASNLSIRNVITSMRLISDIDWADLFEKVSLVDRALRADSTFCTMDFSTRNIYRSAIEQLARGSQFTEIDIARRAVTSAQQQQTLNSQSKDSPKAMLNETEQKRRSDSGYYLIDKGRLEFEKAIEYTPPLRLKIKRFLTRQGVGGYSAMIALVALSLLALGFLIPQFLALPGFAWAVWFLVGFIPASEVAAVMVNTCVTKRLGATPLPALELKNGVPIALRTLIVVPTLLSSKTDLLEQIERLEVHYLSGIEGAVSFALLTDGMDAKQQYLDSDTALLALANAEIDTLNARHSDGKSGARFMLLHRRRLFNSSEKVWMGWERKRGKLRELNRLLRGATDTSFILVNGQAPRVPKDVRYVITLDADTRLPRETALRLIGKMAHPLNRPCFDSQKQRVVSGYGILQPRVTPSLSVGYEGSWFQRVFSAPGGMDPYAAAISDVYQDLFAEGSFTGKGIYDVDMFEAALAGRVTENSMLSHDLFEGIFARSGLASDVEVVEEFPARYDVAAKREHRWTRGDWQLLPWIVSKTGNPKGVTALGRWKLLDNLRRSLVAPMTLLALALCWLLPSEMAMIVTAMLLASMAIPVFIPSLFSFIPHHSGVGIAHHLRLWLGDLQLALSQTYLSLTFLPDKSWHTLDAITRTLVRKWITHQYCLEWTTAAHHNSKPKLSFFGFYFSMLGGLVLGMVVCAIGLLLNWSAWPIILPFALLWLLAPLIARSASQPPVVPFRDALGNNDLTLRLTARRTWRFFETFVTPAKNMLPPDNFQEEPEPVVANRTSPTNIGLYLLSSIVARDFGWTGLMETIERLEASFATLEKMTKYRGHFFNWYDIESLDSLLPEYISSVDSGNFAGHLIALANSLEEWRVEPMNNHFHDGILDNLMLLRARAAVYSRRCATLVAASYWARRAYSNLR